MQFYLERYQNYNYESSFLKHEVLQTKAIKLLWLLTSHSFSQIKLTTLCVIQGILPFFLEWKDGLDTIYVEAVHLYNASVLGKCYGILIKIKSFTDTHERFYYTAGNAVENRFLHDHMTILFNVSEVMWGREMNGQEMKQSQL